MKTSGWSVFLSGSRNHNQHKLNRCWNTIFDAQSFRRPMSTSPNGLVKWRRRTSLLGRSYSPFRHGTKPRKLIVLIGLLRGFTRTLLTLSLGNDGIRMIDFPSHRPPCQVAVGRVGLSGTLQCSFAERRKKRLRSDSAFRSRGTPLGCHGDGYGRQRRRTNGGRKRQWA